MTTHLAVLLEGRKVGTLTQSHRSVFAYAGDYLARADATPLSLSMPLRPEPWPQAQVLPWLEGLLPDRVEVRQRWATQFGVSARNPFAIVTHMGKELPGAVQICRPADVENVVSNRGERRGVTEREIADRLAQLRTDLDSWTVAGERWSLGGAQAKFALARHNEQWYEALGAEPSTHIVKPGVAGYALQGLNEHVTMTAAQQLGLLTARTQYVEFDGQPAIVAERYDRRRTAAGRTIRIHQEDLCQALSSPPAKKYETDGGPGVADISDLLLGRAGEDSNWRFVEAIAYNYLVGASDGHARNYSVLLAAGQVRLAPLYDIASSLPYDPEADDSDLRKTAMAIGGQRRYGRVTAENWARLARRTSIDPDRLADRVRELTHNLPDAIATAIDGLPASPDRNEFRRRFLDRLRAHLRQGTG